VRSLDDVEDVLDRRTLAVLRRNRSDGAAIVAVVVASAIAIAMSAVVVVEVAAIVVRGVTSASGETAFVPCTCSVKRSRPWRFGTSRIDTTPTRSCSCALAGGVVGAIDSESVALA